MIFALGTKLLLVLGVGDAAAKRLAPLGALAGVLAILSLLWAAWGVFDHFNDKAAIERDRIEANNAVLAAQLAAAEAAAKERLRNAQTNSETVEALTDAIFNPAPGDSADPDVRLACEQLRRDGQNTTGIPQCGGR